MRKTENECVGCPPDLGCLGSGCPNRNVEYVYCDLCGEEAEYIIEDEELCEECAKMRLLEAFNWHDIEEKANMLGISLEFIE